LLFVSPGGAGSEDVNFMSQFLELGPEGLDGIGDPVCLRQVAIRKDAYSHVPHITAKAVS
jgi:hypothetical protein